MRVIIAGGGVVGSFLAQILHEKNEVVVIDRNKDKCALLSSDKGTIRAICEDACEPWVLEFAGIKEADLMVAVTGDDEDNLVIGYLSKFEYDVPKVIGRVNNPKNRWLFTPSWGVDVEVSTPDIIAKIIEEETTLGEVVTVMKLRASDVSLVEITLPDDAAALGKPLSELDMPPETLIVTVVREDAMMIPRADTVLREGDKILAVTNIHNQKALEAKLGHG
ncbi:MAG: TrkA family potassium uptake protein [Actinobacteria bacterium]|nr:TrkA family potassium uptake protein [Actinomycetota bacterium]MBU1945186.1 TrkA family potassium uptake protein [Actinomycetota bacterium]MBU2687724.1 TrkA family potassium uptake protein [Actinomycetota bacterium]